MEGDTFTEWVEGETVAITLGSQGFSMITPWVQLPTMGDASQECWHVKLEHLGAAEGSDEIGGFESGMVFSDAGGQMRAGPLFDVLEDDDGGPLSLRVTVTGPGFVAIDEVDVILE
jgi:hypothetical protein